MLIYEQGIIDPNEVAWAFMQDTKLVITFKGNPTTLTFDSPTAAASVLEDLRAWAKKNRE
jgi:hypothetical protein